MSSAKTAAILSWPLCVNLIIWDKVAQIKTDASAINVYMFLNT